LRYAFHEVRNPNISGSPQGIVRNGKDLPGEDRMGSSTKMPPLNHTNFSSGFIIIFFNPRDTSVLMTIRRPDNPVVKTTFYQTPPESGDKKSGYD